MSHCCDHLHLPFRAALGRGWSYQLTDEMEERAGPHPVSAGSDFLEVWAPKFPSPTPASWASVTIPFVLTPPFTQFLFPFCPRAPGTNTGPLWPWSPCSGFCFPCICLVRLGLNPHKKASVNEVCLRNPPTGEQRWGSPASQDGSRSIVQGIPGRGSSRTLASHSHEGLKSAAPTESKVSLFRSSLLSWWGWRPQLGIPEIQQERAVALGQTSLGPLSAKRYL